MTEINQSQTDATSRHIQAYSKDSTAGTGTNGTGGTAGTKATFAGYETGDTIGGSSSLADTYGFITDLSAQSPNLPLPQEGTTSQPVPQTPTVMDEENQGQVLEDYNTQLQGNVTVLIAAATPPLTPAQQQALLAAISSGTSPTDPSLTSLYNTAVATTQLAIQTEYQLPSTWTSASTSDTDWTPSTTLSPFSDEGENSQQTIINNAYQTQLQAQVNITIPSADPPLTAAQIAEINTAVSTGQPLPANATPAMIALLQAVQSEVLDNIQEQFSLPATWLPNSTNAADWQPIAAATGTAGTNETRQSQAIANTLNLANQAEAAAQQVYNSLPPGSVQQVAMGNFLKAVASAIATLQAALQQVQARNAQLRDELTAAKFSELDGKRVMGEATLAAQNKEVQEAEAAGSKASKMGLVMKILGPVVAVITTIIGVLLAPTGLGVVVAAVGIAMLAYSIADQQCGITAKLMSSFKSMLSGLGSPLNYVVGSIIAVVAVAALVLLTMASPGTTAEVAAMTAKQLVVTGVTMLTKQMVLMVSITMLMATDAIQDTIMPLISKLGGSGLTQQIMAAVFTFIVIALISSKAGGSGGGAETVDQASARMAQVATQAVQETVQKMLGVVDEVESSISTSLQACSQAVKDAVSSFLTGLKNTIKGIFSLAGVQGMIGAVPTAVQSASDIIQGIAALAIAAILKQMGSLQAETDILEQMIQMLTQLLDKLTSGISTTADLINQATDFVMGMFDSATSSVMKLNAAGIPSN